MNLKKCEDGYMVYDKETAIKMLYEECPIQYIENTELGFIIETMPILLKPTKRINKSLIVCPIGQYKIELRKYTKETQCINKIKIERTIGTVSPFGTEIKNRWHTHHISDELWDNGICWGNAEEIKDKLCRKMDWYWLTKLCLDLIQDSDPEAKRYYNLYKCVILFLQYQYAIYKKNKVWQRKLEKIILKRTQYKKKNLMFYAKRHNSFINPEIYNIGDYDVA